MPERDNIEKELKDKSDFLYQLKKRQPLSDEDLPDGYFNDLESRLNNELFVKPVVEENKTRIKRLFWYSSIAVAASIALFFLTRTTDNIIYPTLDLAQEEEIIMEEIGVYDLIDLAEMEYMSDDIDAETILLEENIEELLNI